MLRAVAAEVGDNQVRHRGTIGGSVAHGDPASRPPGGRCSRSTPTFVLRGPAGERDGRGGASSSPASSRPRSRPTSCSPRSGCPRPGANGFSYQKFNRRAQDWAIVGAVAVQVRRHHAGRARQHGRRPRCGPRAVEAALAGGASATDAAAARPPRAPSRRRDVNAARRVPRAPGPGAHPPGAGGRMQLDRRPRSAVLAVGSRPRAVGALRRRRSRSLELRRPAARAAGRVDAALASGLRPVVARRRPPGSGRSRRCCPRGSTSCGRRGWRSGIARSLRAARRRARGLGAGRRGVHRARRPAARRARRPTAGWPRPTMTARRSRSPPTRVRGRTRC